jgi:hypothetical protein
MQLMPRSIASECTTEGRKYKFLVISDDYVGQTPSGPIHNLVHLAGFGPVPENGMNIRYHSIPLAIRETTRKRKGELVQLGTQRSLSPPERNA